MVKFIGDLSANVAVGLASGARDSCVPVEQLMVSAVLTSSVVAMFLVLIGPSVLEWCVMPPNLKHFCGRVHNVAGQFIARVPFEQQ